MNADMDIAFNAAAGYDPGAISLGIVLIVAALVFLWGSNAVRALLTDLMHQPMQMGRNTRFVLRVVIIISILLYFLS